MEKQPKEIQFLDPVQLIVNDDCYGEFNEFIVINNFFIINVEWNYKIDYEFTLGDYSTKSDFNLLSENLEIIIVTDISGDEIILTEEKMKQIKEFLKEQNYEH